MIYAWGEGEQAEDYIMHEMLHIALKAIIRCRSRADQKRREEMLVRFICQYMKH